ncbi:MAG: helix-turn-helix domain-containing protein [Oscillospiraceae bacterium]|nr:helix-turn-helix domain-containing protein [Oscillospiraceae bacterium]
MPENRLEMDKDILYVCLLSDALKQNVESPGFNYLCIRDRIIDDEDDESVLSGIIAINENRDLSWLLNLVQQRFLQISQWVVKMKDALIGGCDYQQLVDLCEPILGNFISILDSSYRLLSYTKNITSSDPINVSLLEKGYHTEETIQRFRSARRFELYEQETGVIVSRLGEISRFEVVSKWCRYGGERLLHVVMVCSKIPLSLALVDLFAIFMEHIEICFQRQQRAFPSQIYSSLLHEMLYKELTNPFIIFERAKTADVPFYGHFDAYRIVFKDNSTVLTGRFVDGLMAYMPRSKIIANNYEVSVLNIYSSSNIKEQSLLNLERISALLEEHGALCGISEPFATLSEFIAACAQATRAHALGFQLRLLGNIWQFDQAVFDSTVIKGKGDVFYYNDVYIYLMLHFAQAGSFDALTNTLQNNLLKKLIAYDSENNTQLVQILYAHLVSERRATSSGKLLHMHRNNVLYHISRIEEITGLDLNDYWTRLKLMLAFHFLELQESNRRFFLPIEDSEDSLGAERVK